MLISYIIYFNGHTSAVDFHLGTVQIDIVKSSLIVVVVIELELETNPMNWWMYQLNIEPAKNCRILWVM